MKKLALSLILLTITACSSSPTKEQLALDEKVYEASYSKYAENAKVAQIHLTDDGKVKSIDIGNQNLKAPTRKTYEDGIAKTLVKESFYTLRTLAGGNLAIAAVAIEGFKNVGDRNYDSNNSNQEAHETIGGDKAGESIDKSSQANQANQANSHQETHETIGGDKAGGYVDKHQEANQANDSSTNDSNNGGNITKPNEDETTL
jgi:hypothetical protein